MLIEFYIILVILFLLGLFILLYVLLGKNTSIPPVPPPIPPVPPPIPTPAKSLEFLYSTTNISIPLNINVSSPSNFTINWGDGTENITSGNISHSYNSTGDYIITFYDAENITSLQITKLNISLTNNVKSMNIINLPNITDFQCYNNDISGTLDVASMPKLTNLICYNNKITNLDVSNLTQLITLSCGNNQISVLDVSSLINLVSLYCDNNQISILDVSNLTNLGWLNCDSNNLTILDTTNLIYLGFLNCSFNKILNLDLSNNIDELVSIICLSNTDLVISFSSSNNYLKILQYSNCNLNTLNISNLTALETLWLDGNNFTSFDLTGLNKLNYITFYDNKLTDTSIDNIIITVDGYGTFNGNLALNLNTGNRTSASDIAYANLISRGWTIIL